MLKLNNMLNLLTKLIYLKFKPKIIVVSGTSGKTITIEIIKRFLSNRKNIFSIEYHKDHKLSIPLTFLLEKDYKLLKNILKGLKILFSTKNYPEYILLEFGFEDPKVVDYWTKNLMIDYLIITSIGEVPAYSEVFVGPENIKRKKKKLIEIVKSTGLIILNNDDISCLELVEKENKNNVVYFGFAEDSDFRCSHYEIICNLYSTPSICGTSLEITTKFGKKKIFLRNLFGKGIIYSCLASTALLYNLGFELEEIGNYLETFSGVKHRSELIKSKRGYYILDDSLHLTQASFWNIFDIFTKIPAKRKIALIGDCITAGKYGLEFHFEIGEKLKDVCDFVITFGLRAKYTKDSLIAYGFDESKTNHFYHTQHNELLNFLEELLKPDDLILITGDKRLNLHRIVDHLS